MRLFLHPQVFSDIDKVMEYYGTTATAQLADDFYVELRGFMVEAAKRPESFSIRERDIRRVNLERFPYAGLQFGRAVHARACVSGSSRSALRRREGSARQW